MQQLYVVSRITCCDPVFFAHRNVHKRTKVPHDPRLSNNFPTYACILPLFPYCLLPTFQTSPTSLGFYNYTTRSVALAPAHSIVATSSDSVQLPNMETINSVASSAAKLVWGETSTDKTTTAADTANDSSKPLADRTANPAANTTKMHTETQGQEPVSGKLGDTSKGEPFDAGNIGSTVPALASPTVHMCWTLNVQPILTDIQSQPRPRPQVWRPPITQSPSRLPRE